MSTPTPATESNPTPPAHPWSDKDGEISAKIAIGHVTHWLLELGVSAKAAAACSYTIAADLEERGHF